MPIQTPASRPDDRSACGQKVGRWLLAGWEQRFVARNLHRVPRWLETHHLTLLTLPWCAAVLAAGWLAAHVDLRISHFGIGPTELRLALVGANQAVVALGTDALARSLPIAAAAALLGVVAVVVRTQRRVWRLDMKAKAQTTEEQEGLAHAA